MSVCLGVSLTACLSLSLFVYMFVRPFFCVSVYLYSRAHIAMCVCLKAYISESIKPSASKFGGTMSINSTQIKNNLESGTPLAAFIIHAIFKCRNVQLNVGDA